MLKAEDWAARIGTQVNDLRLLRNLTRAAVAERAGLSVDTVRRLETGVGSGASLDTLIRVLRTLGREAWLDTLAPEVSISPLAMLDRPKPRRRASGSRKRGKA